MFKALAIPLILYSVLLPLIHGLRFNYPTEVFGKECISNCIRAVNRWARLQVQPTINVEVAIRVGIGCDGLCFNPRSTNDIVITKELRWDGFEDVRKLTLTKPYVCTFEKTKKNEFISAICGYTSDTHQILRRWEVVC